MWKISKWKDNVEEKPVKITMEKTRGLQETQLAENRSAKGDRGVGRRSERNLGESVPWLEFSCRVFKSEDEERGSQSSRKNQPCPKAGVRERGTGFLGTGV